MKRSARIHHRLERSTEVTLKSRDFNYKTDASPIQRETSVDCGWGKLIFGQTFRDNNRLAKVVCSEESGKRDIAFYIRDPHVVISLAPQEIFLDPSHTYRLWMDRYRVRLPHRKGFFTRLLNKKSDGVAIHNIFQKLHMAPVSPEFIWKNRKSQVLTHILAEDKATGKVIGTITGIDHKAAFNDTENGSSMWALAVDPDTGHAGIGEALVRGIIEYFITKGRAFMDLSVMHDNTEAISLYEKLGFQRVPVFAIKHKNPFNEPLFITEPPEGKLNPYASIIVKEAMRRGIFVKILGDETDFFSLAFGGRSVVCHESLTEATSAIAMAICDDKRLTNSLLSRAGLKVPAQRLVNFDEEDTEFLKTHKRVVVKPLRGEQGRGISVDVRTKGDLRKAIKSARKVCDDILLEEYLEGEDLRVVVIGFKVIAAAIRKPPTIIGTGAHTIRDLIQRQSRRRFTATGGESHIPLDEETERCVRVAGYKLDSILPAGISLIVRKTANLHTGGTIHDVTETLSQNIRDAAIKAAKIINIPVVGMDFLVPSEKSDHYTIIEANERPGLANHEPQPTVERFLDHLFPNTAVRQ